MQSTASIVIGVYVVLLAVFLCCLGAFLFADPLNLSAGAFVLSLVGTIFVGGALVVVFPFAYAAAKYKETHRR